MSTTTEVTAPVKPFRIVWISRRLSPGGSMESSFKVNTELVVIRSPPTLAALVGMGMTRTSASSPGQKEMISNPETSDIGTGSSSVSSAAAHTAKTARITRIAKFI